MFADQLHDFKKVLVCSFILVGLTCQFSMAQSSTAATIIDLKKQQPLGAMTTNTVGDRVTFSLGNGRALLIHVTSKKKHNGFVMRDLMLRQDATDMKARSVAARRFKRNLKW
ncbi:MAG: hypothetical protein GY927_05140 [bacterium]|nr:hypothetical protein [bacterium]